MMKKSFIIIFFMLLASCNMSYAAIVYTHNNMSAYPANVQDVGSSWAGMKFVMNMNASGIEAVKAAGVTLEELRLYNSAKSLLLSIISDNSSIKISYDFVEGVSYYIGLASSNPSVNKGRYTAASGLFPAARESFNWTGSYDTSDDSSTQWNGFEEFIVKTGTCTPEWSAYYSPDNCFSSPVRTKLYTDINDCGEGTPPSDNGTLSYCDITYNINNSFSLSNEASFHLILWLLIILSGIIALRSEGIYRSIIIFTGIFFIMEGIYIRIFFDRITENTATMLIIMQSFFIISGIGLIIFGMTAFLDGRKDMKKSSENNRRYRG